MHALLTFALKAWRPAAGHWQLVDGLYPVRRVPIALPRRGHARPLPVRARAVTS